MENLNLLKTIIFIAVAGVISYFFTFPLLAEMQINQEQTALFNGEIDRIDTVNLTLQQLQASISAIPINSRQKLDRFLPTTIDQLVVLKEVEALLQQSNISPSSLSTDRLENAASTAGSGQPGEGGESTFITTTALTLAFEAPYEDLKDFLLRTEEHPYVLQFTSLSMTPVEDTPDLIAVEAQLELFSFNGTSTDSSNQ